MSDLKALVPSTGHQMMKLLLDNMADRNYIQAVEKKGVTYYRA
jgi:hypothetical protein